MRKLIIRFLQSKGIFILRQTGKTTFKDGLGNKYGVFKR